VVLVAVMLSAVAAALFPTIRSELTPSEDRSSAFLRISAPQGVSLDYLSQRMRQVETIIQPLRDSGEIVSTFAIAGSGSSQNSGFIVMSLAPWDQRERSQQDIILDITSRVRDVPGVQAFAFQPNSLGIRGAGSGLQFAIVG